MSTAIFVDYAAFLLRTDKLQNGVSPEFAVQNPGWEADNETNNGCYDCFRCFRCSDCYDCSDCSHCYDCSDCYDCYDCSSCSDCSDCSGCSICYDSSGKKVDLVIPKIEAIHGKILESVEVTGALNMSEWHTCETTHCRAGWVVTIAGEAGKELAEKTSTEFAAMAIYGASSVIRVRPDRFYDSDEIAMADIRRCAAEEVAMNEASK